MLAELARILATALVSSLFTLWMTVLFFSRFLLPRLERDFQQKIDLAIEEMGRTVEERVKRGVLEGVAAIPSTEMLQSTTRAAAQTGIDLVGAGIDALLGGRRDRRG